MLSTFEWIEKIKLIFGDTYDYSKVNYKGINFKVTLICKYHGDFEKNPRDIIKGTGCPKCGFEKTKKSKVYTFDDIVNKANIIHKNKYAYPLQKVNGSKSKLKIICPIHGDFEQETASHLKGKGCKKCGYILTSTNLFSNTKDFIEKANIIHNSLYTYEKVNYINCSEKVEITCCKHGNFWQIPSNHLNGNGCPKCSTSKGELIIETWLKDNNIYYTSQYKLEMNEICRNTNIVYVDFNINLNNKQYFIEYDGEQHFNYVPFLHNNNIINFEKQVNRDKVLTDFCELHKDKITLIRFNYLQSYEEIINELNKL